MTAKKNKILVFILMLSLSFISGAKFVQVKQNCPQSESEDKEVVFTIGERQVILTSSSIDISREFETDGLSIHVDAANYPKLFKPDNEFARLNVKEISGGGVENAKLIYIARQIPSHGTMLDSYFIVIDPEIGKVVDEGYKSHFGSGVWFNNSCTNCSLPILEFREYDRRQQKYVLVNNKHIKEFIELQKQYRQIGDKEICRINNKDMTINEALRVANDDDKCADLGMGQSNAEPSDLFITIGEYKQILSNLEQIIEGKNIRMFTGGCL